MHGSSCTKRDSNGQPFPVLKLDTRRVVTAAAGLSISDQLDYWLNVLLDGELSAESRRKLADWYVAHAPRCASTKHATIDLAHTLTVIPEFQLA